MGEAEGGIRLVAIDDHRHEPPVYRVPDRSVAGERWEFFEHPGTMFRDVAAIEAQALLADADRGVGVHELEGAFRAIRILARQAVEVVEDRKDERCRRSDPRSALTRLPQPRIGSLDRRLVLDRQDLRLQLA